MSDLIIEGAKGIPDGLYVIKDGGLFKYKAKGGSVRSYHITDRPKGEWIPCSERLPKENGHYLVTFHQTATKEDLGFDMDDTDVRKMRYDTKHGWRTPRHIPSWINDAVVSTVLAWMPLPEPYRAERRTDE